MPPDVLYQKYQCTRVAHACTRLHSVESKKGYTSPFFRKKEKIGILPIIPEQGHLGPFVQKEEKIGVSATDNLV